MPLARSSSSGCPAKGKELIGKLGRIKRTIGQRGYGFFDLNGIHSGQSNLIRLSSQAVACGSSGLPLNGATLISPSRLRVCAMS